MLTEQQLQAWDELELGPCWVRRGVPALAEAGARDQRHGSSERQERHAEEAGQPADSWARIREEVSGCPKCGLCETRTRTVFGSGREDARWMLIGEAPGAEEDASGEPFVGQAGRLLEQMLASIGLSRAEDVFITNVLKCRPPGNRNPEPLEAATCAPYLHRQIELLQPDLILLLGRFAVQSVLGTGAALAGLRRQVHHYRAVHRDIPVVCTYHPAYLLRNPTEKRKSWEDLCLAHDVATRERELRA